jgi:hypothetical protein
MSEFWIGMGVGMFVGMLWSGFMRARAERRAKALSLKENNA